MPGVVHALLSPSAAARWLACPGSVPLTEKMPNEESDYAKEGTIAHHCAERILNGETASVDMLEPEEAAFMADKGLDATDMLGHVMYYVDFVSRLGGERFVEQELDLTSITHEADAVGTSDAVVIKDDTLYVVDLKYGMGVKVDAENNPQIAIYARAAYNAYECFADFSKVHMIIVQPRLDHISEWEVSVSDLIAWTDTFTVKADECHKMRALPKSKWKFNPTVKACRWCKARGTCAARAKFALSAAGVDILKDRKDLLLNPSDLGICLDKLELIEDWVSVIRETATDMLRSGTAIPGWKLVRGKEGNRKWSDESAAEDTLLSLVDTADDGYTKKLISPAQADKLVKAKKIKKEDLAAIPVERAPGKPNLAPESDPRPAYTELSESDFPDETAQN